jgi:transcriptional regulator with XRE-family HTH domain
MNFETVAQKVKRLRELAGWSQSELARRIGISGAAISEIEKGGRMPTVDVLQKLGKIFRLSLSDMVDEKVIVAKKVHAFYAKFGMFEELSRSDQGLVLELIERLKG